MWWIRHMFILTCRNIHINISIQICLSTNTNMYEWICVYIPTNVCVHVCTELHVFIYMAQYGHETKDGLQWHDTADDLYICIFVFLHINMCVYTHPEYLHICIFIFTQHVFMDTPHSFHSQYGANNQSYTCTHIHFDACKHLHTYIFLN